MGWESLVDSLVRVAWLVGVLAVGNLLGWGALGVYALARVGRIKLLFAWFDMWIGAYWDRTNRRLHLLPLPCLGVVIDFKREP